MPVFQLELDLKKLQSGASGAVRILNTVSTGANNASKSIKQIGDQSQKSAKEIAAMNSAMNRVNLSGMARSVAALGAAYMAVGEALAFVKKGLDYSTSLEQSRIGMASLITAMTNITDSQGTMVEGQEKYQEALKISSEMMKEIQILSLESSATTDTLAQGVQNVMGSALQFGIALKDIPQFAITASKAMTAMGIPLQQMRTEIESLISGNINKAQDLLAPRLGLDKATIQGWHKQGIYIEEVTKALSAFELASKDSANTLPILLSNLGEAISVVSAEASKGLMDSLKSSVKQLDGFLKDTSDGTFQVGKDIAVLHEALTDFETAIGEGIKDATQGLIDSLTFLNANFEAIATGANLAMAGITGLAAQKIILNNATVQSIAANIKEVGSREAVIAAITGQNAAERESAALRTALASASVQREQALLREAQAQHTANVMSQRSAQSAYEAATAKVKETATTTASARQIEAALAKQAAAYTALDAARVKAFASSGALSSAEAANASAIASQKAAQSAYNNATAQVKEALTVRQTNNALAQQAAAFSVLEAAKAKAIASASALTLAQENNTLSLARQTAAQTAYNTASSQVKETAATKQATAAINEQTLAHNALDAAKLKTITSSNALAAAQLRVTTATNTATKSMGLMAMAGAGISRVGSSILAAFGGPVGVAITAAAAGIYLLATREDEAEKAARLLTEAQKGVKESLDLSAEAAKKFSGELGEAAKLQMELARQKAAEAVSMQWEAIDKELKSVIFSYQDWIQVGSEDIQQNKEKAAQMDMYADTIEQLKMQLSDGAITGKQFEDAIALFIKQLSTGDEVAKNFGFSLQEMFSDGFFSRMAQAYDGLTQIIGLQNKTEFVGPIKPEEEITVTGRPRSTGGRSSESELKKQAREAETLRKNIASLQDEINSLIMPEAEYREWALVQEMAELEKKMPNQIALIQQFGEAQRAAWAKEDAEEAAEKQKENLDVQADFYSELIEKGGQYAGMLKVQTQAIQAQIQVWRDAGIPEEYLQQMEYLATLEIRTDFFAGLERGFLAAGKDADNFAMYAENTVTSAFGHMGDALEEFAQTGKLNFSDMTKSILADLAQMAAQAAASNLFKAAGSAIGSLFGGGMSAGNQAVSSTFGFTFGAAAKGAIAPAGISGYSNSIVNSPTLFSSGAPVSFYANGGGIMGEAGPEAIMPLSRDASGRLGVNVNGGSSPTVSVNVYNETNVPNTAIETTKSTDANGNVEIKNLIISTVAGNIQQGGVIKQAINAPAFQRIARGG